MESTPDSGVEIKNALIAPLFAPFFFKSVAAGNTPHDQSGNGTPKKAALITEEKRPVPRWLRIKDGLSTICSIPAITRPNRIYREESRRISHDSLMIA